MYQRRLYKICVRGLCGIWLKLKINVRLLDEICLPQRLSNSMLYIQYIIFRFRKVLLEISTGTESV